MSGQTLGKVFCVCFLLIWISGPLYFALDILLHGGPLIMAVMGGGMAFLGIIMMIGVLTGTFRSQSSPDSTGPPELSGHVGESAAVVYGPPTTCPSCGAELSEENVDWVGPLRLQCPYCGATIDAVKRTL